MQRHQDFIVDFGSTRGAGHRVRVLESPAGNARGSFEPPLTGGEVRQFFGDLVRGRSAGRTLLRDLVAFQPSGARPTARSVGRKLFEALFQGEVRDRYVGSVEHTRAAGQGLRIKIRLDPEDPAAARLHSLPWEFLYRPDRRRFLARSRLSPVVRYLDVPQPAELPPVPLPLRVLMVMANPQDTEPLALDREREVIDKVWREHRAVEIVFLPREKKSPASLRALRQALLEKEYHVLHFMGHGGFDRETGAGTLAFESESGLADPASGEELGGLLHDFESLRLVVVNACHSAAATDAEGRNPFTGVATALVREGIPAVVAMQTAISDRAAIAFSRELYHRLAAGDPIDAAVVEGRRAIGRPSQTDEWGTPVLFLRAREGRIFDLPSAERAEVERPPSWRWNPQGVAVLAAGGAGLALFVGLGYLLLWNEPALRAAVTVMTAVATALLGALVRRDPAPGRRLSHWVARHRPARWGLALLALLAVVAWGLAGRQILCRSECGPLCPPPGVRRVLVGGFEDLISDVDGAGKARAADTASFLVQTLRLADGLWSLAEDGVADERVRRCFDVAIRGTVAESGEGIALSAELSRRGGLHLATIEARGAPDDLDGSLVGVQSRLAIGILQALDVAPDPELLQRIRHFPTADPEALELNRQGVASFLQGDLFAAEIRLEAALERDPGYADANNNLGMVKLRQGEYDAAIARFRKAIELLPRHPSYPYNLGLALGRSGRRRDAVAAYEQAVDLDPTHSRAYNNLGFVLLALGELDRARDSLKRGLAFARDESAEATLYKNFGRVALEGGAVGEALEHLGKAIDRFEPYPEALFYRAVALEDLGRGPEACAAWRSYAAVAESDEDDGRRLAGRERAAAPDCLEEE